MYFMLSKMNSEPTGVSSEVRKDFQHMDSPYRGILNAKTKLSKVETNDFTTN